MDHQLLERALERDEFDLDSIISSLTELRIEPAHQGTPPASAPATANHPKDGANWVDLIIGEVLNASDVNERKARVSAVLGALENTIYAAAASSHASPAQVTTLMQENSVLKRAVVIQYRRQKESREKNAELERTVSQYQVQLKASEYKNYELNLLLKQAHQRQSDSMHGNFHPDVF